MKLKLMTLVFLLGLFQELSASTLKISNSNQIINSNYERAHQQVILESIYSNCGLWGKTNQLSSLVTSKKIDQYVYDYEYLTQLEVFVKIDQYIFDRYFVVVLSEGTYSGYYFVRSVSCVKD